jgi:hypothetical protein
MIARERACSQAPRLQPRMEEKGSNGKSVLGNLPNTRPERLGGPRAAAKKPARAKPAKPAPAAAKPAPAAAKPRRRGPAAVSAGAPPLRPRHRHEPPPDPIGPPRGTELVTTAIHATGELARIGLTVGGQVLKRAVDRLPRP